MATFTATEQKKYCFPQEKPATKQELAQHIKNAEQSGRGMTHEEFTCNIERFLQNL